jgi:hypothetical protein
MRPAGEINDDGARVHAGRCPLQQQNPAVGAGTCPAVLLVSEVDANKVE